MENYFGDFAKINSCFFVGVAGYFERRERARAREKTENRSFCWAWQRNRCVCVCVCVPRDSWTLAKSILPPQ